jgi:hypothetical protein
MSKVIPILPETVPEKNGDQMIVTLRVADLKAIVRAEVQAALSAQQPPIHRIVYPLKEAAEMISVPPTWLAARARAEEINATRLGHYVTFAEEDLKNFVEKMRKKETIG